MSHSKQGRSTYLMGNPVSRYVCVYLYLSIDTYMCVYMYMCMHTHICIDIYRSRYNTQIKRKGITVFVPQNAEGMTLREEMIKVTKCCIFNF